MTSVIDIVNALGESCENDLRKLIPASQCEFGKYVGINALDERGRSALIIATAKSDDYDTENIMRILIEAGADVNLQDRNSNYALMFAVEQCDICNVCDNCRGSYRKRKMEVCNRKKNIVNMLLNAGADINLLDHNGNNIFMSLPGYSDTSVVAKILLEAGADPYLQNIIGRNSLMKLSEYPLGASAIKLIVKSDNTNLINLQDNEGMSALMISILHYDTFCNVKLLMDANIDVNLQNIYKQTALDIYFTEARYYGLSKTAIKYAKYSGYPVVRSCLENGVTLTSSICRYAKMCDIRTINAFIHYL